MTSLLCIFTFGVKGEERVVGGKRVTGDERSLYQWKHSFPPDALSLLPRSSFTFPSNPLSLSPQNHFHFPPQTPFYFPPDHLSLFPPNPLSLFPPDPLLLSHPDHLLFFLQTHFPPQTPFHGNFQLQAFLNSQVHGQYCVDQVRCQPLMISFENYFTVFNISDANTKSINDTIQKSFKTSEIQILFTGG